MIIKHALIIGILCLLAYCQMFESQTEQEATDASPSQEVLDEQPDYLKEYEIAEQECEDVGGKWVTKMHWDGWAEFGYTLRCLEESQLPAHNTRWEDRLLPYDISVTNSRETYKEIGFEHLEVEKEPDRDTTEN